MIEMICELCKTNVAFEWVKTTIDDREFHLCDNCADQTYNVAILLGHTARISWHSLILSVNTKRRENK